MKLEKLKHPDDDPDLVREACFYVGWQLRSPDSWEYRDLFSYDEGEVELSKLIKAVKNKHERLKKLKPEGSK